MFASWNFFSSKYKNKFCYCVPSGLVHIKSYGRSNKFLFGWYPRPVHYEGEAIVK